MHHALFDALRQVDIRSVLHFVDRHCQFLDAFDYVLGRYVKQEADDRVLIACLIAWATNMGLGRMGPFPILAPRRSPLPLNVLLMEERSHETLDLRVLEALLEYLYSTGRVSRLEKSPGP